MKAALITLVIGFVLILFCNMAIYRILCHFLKKDRLNDAIKEDRLNDAIRKMMDLKGWPK